MNELTTRQASIIIAITSIAMKLMALPSLIISQTGSMVWLTFLMMFLIDGAILSIVLQVLKRHPKLTMKQFLEKHFGSIFTKIFFALVGILFAIKSASVLRDIYEFYTETSYVDLSWIVFLLPTVLLLIYVSSKRLRVLGRVSEIFVYFVLITIGIVIVFALTSADYLSILPLFDKGINPVIKAGLDYCFWFGDFLLLFFMCGKIKVNKYTCKTLFLSYVISSVIVLFLSFSHYAIYGSISALYKTTISDIIEYIPRLATSGRFTWVVVFLWPIASYFTIFTYSIISVKSFEITFNLDENKSKKMSYVSIGIVVLTLVLTGFSQISLITFISSYFKYFVIVVQYLLPLCFPVLLVIDKKKGEKKYVKKFMEQ